MTVEMWDSMLTILGIGIMIYRNFCTILVSFCKFEFFFKIIAKN